MCFIEVGEAMLFLVYRKPYLLIPTMCSLLCLTVRAEHKSLAELCCLSPSHTGCVTVVELRSSRGTEWTAQMAEHWKEGSFPVRSMSNVQMWNAIQLFCPLDCHREHGNA